MRQRFVGRTKKLPVPGLETGNSDALQTNHFCDFGRFSWPSRLRCACGCTCGARFCAGAACWRCCCQLRNLFSSSRAWAGFRSCTGGAGLAWGCDQPCAPRRLSFWLAAPWDRGLSFRTHWFSHPRRHNRLLRTGLRTRHVGARDPIRLGRSSPAVADAPPDVRSPEDSQRLRPRVGLLGAYVHRLPLSKG